MARYKLLAKEVDTKERHRSKKNKMKKDNRGRIQSHVDGKRSGWLEKEKEMMKQTSELVGRYGSHKLRQWFSEYFYRILGRKWISVGAGSKLSFSIKVPRA